MKNFQLKAKIEFEAEDIDDAFLFLEEHFRALRLGEDPPRDLSVGEINIEPIK